MPTKAMTAAQRQKQRRERLKNGGFKQIVLWVHKVDEDRLKEFQDTLVKPDVCDRHNKQS